MLTESSAACYRERAEEARLQAERVHDAILRRHFLDIAEAYDELAQGAERLDRQRGASRLSVSAALDGRSSPRRAGLPGNCD
jgi:hypothetical protein